MASFDDKDSLSGQRRPTCASLNNPLKGKKSVYLEYFPRLCGTEGAKGPAELAQVQTHEIAPSSASVPAYNVIPQLRARRTYRVRWRGMARCVRIYKTCTAAL